MKTKQWIAVAWIFCILVLTMMVLPAMAQSTDSVTAPSTALDLTAKVVIVAGVVASALQAVKQIIPQLSGWGARIVGFLAGAVTVITTAPAGQALSPTTLAAAVVTGLSAIGVHGLVKASATQASTIHPMP